MLAAPPCWPRAHAVADSGCPLVWPCRYRQGDLLQQDRVSTIIESAEAAHSQKQTAPRDMAVNYGAPYDRVGAYQSLGGTASERKLHREYSC